MPTNDVDDICFKVSSIKKKINCIGSKYEFDSESFKQNKRYSQSK